MSKTTEETFEEKKARLARRMRSQATGKMTPKKLTRKERAKVSETYDIWVNEFYDNMTLEQMSEVDIDSMGGTKKFAFLDVMIQKRVEEAQAKAEELEADEEVKQPDEPLANPDDAATE